MALLARKAKYAGIVAQLPERILAHSCSHPLYRDALPAAQFIQLFGGQSRLGRDPTLVVLKLFDKGRVPRIFCQCEWRASGRAK